MWWATVADDVVYGGVVFVACNAKPCCVLACLLQTVMSCGGMFLTVYLLVSTSLIDHVRLEPKNVKEQSVLVWWLPPQNSERTNRGSKDPNPNPI